MGYVQLFVIALVLAFGVKLWNKYEHAAQAAGIAKAEQQIAETALASERDSKRETAAILAKRPIRTKALATKTTARKVADVQRAKSDPVFQAWDSQLVPIYVFGRLRDNANTDETVRSGATDSEPRPAMQTGSSTAATLYDKWRLGPLRRIATGHD